MKQKNNKIKISTRVKLKLFEDFLLNLSSQTKRNFSYFGNINKKSVKTIVKNDLQRKDKIRFFLTLDNALIVYGFLTTFEKPEKKHNCMSGIVVADKFQQKGYGIGLYKYVINFAWKKQFTKMWVTVYADNFKALAVHKSLGFEIEGIFMSDEKQGTKYRDKVSMALFKNQSLKNKRKKLLKKLECKNFKKYKATN